MNKKNNLYEVQIMLSNNILFQPFKMGDIELKNRIIMAPLTRCRAINNRIPNQLMQEYYTQRASAGLIITEATSISKMGVGYPSTPGIWSEEQILGWKAITEAIHQKDGKIMLQLWHVGRISDPIYLDGELPVAPSAIKPSGHVNQLRPLKDFETPRALELSEIPAIVDSYKKAAVNAKLAGFDGVEIHGANGYLIDQFLQDKTNHRSDEYGGNIENRARLALEVTDAVISVWGAGRVGMHLSPNGGSNDIEDSDPIETFTYLVKELSKRNLAFIFVRESLSENAIGPLLRASFNGAYIANQKLTKETGAELVSSNKADAVAYGSLFIANPDLPHRFKNNLPLNKSDPTTFYGPDHKGYTDYPLFIKN
jgi:2,4-dienoyl-CoA reductase-like NADH-dependent reductase (Old Yellow Enzyme family)